MSVTPEEREVAAAAASVPDLLSSAEAGPAAVRGGAMRAGTFFGGTLIATGAAALLFRHLGTVEAGQYATAMSISAIVTGFTDLGLTAIGTRELAVLRGESRDRVARNLLGMRLVLTVIGVIATAAFAFAAYGETLGFGVLIAGIGVLFQNTQVTLSVPLISSLRFGWVSTLDLLRQAIVAALVVVFVLLGARLLPFLATSGVAALVVLFPTVMLVRGLIPVAASFDLGEWKAMLAPVLTYSAAAAASVLYFRIAIILVSLIAGAHELGYYGLSFRIVEVLFTVPAIIVGAAFPIFAHAARDDLTRLGYAVGKVFEVATLGGVWLAVSIAVGAHFAVRVVGGPEFLPAVPILTVQGFAVGASFVGVVWAYTMLSLHLHRLILVFSLAMLALVTTLVAVLTVLDGAQGAAIGTATAELVGAVVGGVLVARRQPALAPPLKVLPKAALAGVLAAAPLLAGGIPDVVQIVLSTLIYASVLLALRAYPRELLALLPERWGRLRGQ
jgi:O-antigen/teichoic acid export membrane protein